MRYLACLLSLTFVIACGDKKKPAAEEETEVEDVCESNADCDTGFVCLAGECASAKGADIYINTKSAVTPDKVKRHLDQVNENAQKRADELLKDL